VGADDHHSPGRGWEGASGVRASPSRVQERWRTLSVGAPVEAVREALARSLRRGKSLPALAVTGRPLRDGLVLRCTIAKKPLGAQIALAGWEGGTQVHLSVLADQNPSESELERIRGWLELCCRRTVGAQSSARSPRLAGEHLEPTKREVSAGDA